VDEDDHHNSARVSVCKLKDFSEEQLLEHIGKSRIYIVDIFREVNLTKDKPPKNGSRQLAKKSGNGRRPTDSKQAEETA
jgi:hypothetical protein